MFRRLFATVALVALAYSPVAAQDSAASAPATAPVAETPAAEAQAPEEASHAKAAPAENADYIMPHIVDGYWVELPAMSMHMTREFCIAKQVSEHECVSPWPDFHLGPITGNLYPTKHVIMLLLASLIVGVVLISSAGAARRDAESVGHTRGFAGAMEAMILYIRNEVILPNVGHHGNAFVPYLLALFFFILGANLLGLIPFFATATSNIAVTATLAIITFLVIEGAGIAANGAGYIFTIIYWNKDLPLYLRIPMMIIVSPVEMIGKFTKPIALAIRLFANMTAGHIILLALVGLIFSFGSYVVGLVPVAMAVAISALELMVAFLQAYIFTMLSSVFIGIMRESHH